MSIYQNKTILKALFFTPIPTQLLLAGTFMVLNHAFDFDSIITVLVANLIIYSVYCIVVIPIAYTISILLVRKNWLNLINILFGSVLMWLIITILGYLIFTQSLPNPLWKLFSDWYFYLIALFTGLCYWGLLHYSSPNSIIDNANRTDY